MFGVVPKVIWGKCCAADELNRIPLSLTCLLIRAHGKNILVDTGLGSKEDDKFQRMFAVDRTPTLLESLKHLGLDRDDIHMVINTHLHFDHAGGNTMKEANGTITSTFPKAQYFIQHGEYEMPPVPMNEPKPVTGVTTSRRLHTSINGNSCAAIRKYSPASLPWSPPATRAAIRVSNLNRKGRWLSSSAI